MELSDLPAHISHLDVRSGRQMPVSMRKVHLHNHPKSKASAAALLLCALFASQVKAAVNVSFSASAPAATQAEFIANTTNQYFSTLTRSPFFSNTYSLVISSKNPNYQAPMPTPVLDPNKVVADFILYATTTYLYGWMDGQHYEREHTLGMVGSYIVNCSTPSYFYNIQSTSSAWHLGTCLDSLSTLNNAIYQQNFSTPTVIPGTN